MIERVDSGDAESPWGEAWKTICLGITPGESYAQASLDPCPSVDPWARQPTTSGLPRLPGGRGQAEKQLGSAHRITSALSQSGDGHFTNDWESRRHK